MRRPNLLSALIASAAILLVVGCAATDEPVAAASGSPAPAASGDQAAPTAAAWSEDFEAAQAEAKKSGKLMMVDFNATWCGPCQEYKKNVFPTSDFTNATKDYVLVDIDIDKQPELAQKFGVDGIPDIRVLNSDGKEITKLVGFGGGDRLIDELKKAQSTAGKG